MTTINAQTIINAVMQAHACAPEEGSDLISFAISAKGVQKVKNCKANLLRFAELVRKNARAFGGGIARTIKPRAAVIWPAQAVRLVYELLQDEQYQDATALAEEQCGAVFYEGYNHKTKSPQAIMMWAPQAVAGLPECLRSARVDSGRYCVYDIASGMTVMGHHKTRANAEASAVTTWQGVSEEKRAEALAKAKPSNPATARAQWLAEHGIISEEATAERIESEELAQEEAATLGQRFDAERAKRRAARDAERAAQAVAKVVADAVAAVTISDVMQPSEAADSRELVTCEAGEGEASAQSMGSASTAPAWQPVPGYVPPVPSSTDFGQSKPTAFRGDDMPDSGDDAPATPSEPSNQAPATTQGVEGVARQNLDAAPISKKTTFGTLKNGDAFCFLSGENEMVYVRCKGGYRPGRGGDCMRLRREYVVYLYDLTPPAVESTDAPMAPAVETVQDAPVVAAPIAAPVAQRYTFKPGVQDQKIVSKSGKWMAATRMTSDGLFELGFKIGSGCSWSTTYPTASDRMKALQSMARAADAPTDTPPTGGLPCPDSQASNPPEKTEGREGSPVQISTPKPVETFKQAGPVRVDLASMIAKGVAPEALIGLGVYCKGDMANPSGSGAITGFSHSDFYGLVVDVTLESGKVWRAVRTGEFLTGWFSLDAKMHGAPYLAQLAATVASLKASTSAAKEQAGNARAKALIDLAEQYPQLKRAESSYAGGKLAAANMRILLKAAFKGVKFSVTSDYNSVRVNWEDGPTDDQVNEVVGRFDIGASDAHSDYFYTVSTAFSDLFGGVQYLHTRRHESDALVQQAIDELYQNRDEKPTVQDYRKCSGVFNWDGQNYENRRMRELMNSTPAFSATKSHAKS